MNRKAAILPSQQRHHGNGTGTSPKRCGVMNEGGGEPMGITGEDLRYGITSMKILDTSQLGNLSAR